jgi:hypothetical protein
MVRLWETPTPTTANQTNSLIVPRLEAEQPIVRGAIGNRANGCVRDHRRTTGAAGRPTGDVRVLQRLRPFGESGPHVLSQGDDQVGATPVVVLSHDTWQTQFGGDPRVLNRDLILDGEPFRVIGVLPPGAFDRDPARYWVPLLFTPSA